jgi:hypothetical protein
MNEVSRAWMRGFFSFNVLRLAKNSTACPKMMTAKAAVPSAAALLVIFMHFFHGFHQSWFPKEALPRQLFVILAKITFQINQLPSDVQAFLCNVH